MCVGGSGIGGGRGAEGGSNVLFFARCFASTVVWCHFFFPHSLLFSWLLYTEAFYLSALASASPVLACGQTECALEGWWDGGM